MNILYKNEIIRFTHDDFPILISGAPSSGSSFFSIVLMINLYKQGEKIVLFSSYEQAKVLFKEEFNNKLNENALIIESGDDSLFLEQLDKNKDFSKRIILFKNIDNYDSKLFNKLKDMKLVIFSGDLDNCEFKEELLKKEFKTRVFFSYPNSFDEKNKIDIPKYCAHIIGDKYNGLVKIDVK